MAAEKRAHSTKRSDEGRRDRPRASKRPEQQRSAEYLPDDDGTVAEREYDDYVLADRDSAEGEQDVLLDVPVVKVDEIKLKVEELRARVSLQAEVLDLVRLNVGADVFIGQVGLEINGVEAQALLKVRLDNVVRIIDRVLTTIDRNPQIVEQITAGVQSAVEDVGGGAGGAVGELGERAGTAVEKVGEGAGSAVEGVGEGAGSAVEDVGESAGSAVEHTGETAMRTAEGAGTTVRQAATGGQDSEERTAKPPGASGRSRRVTRPKARSKTQAGASGDRSPRS